MVAETRTHVEVLLVSHDRSALAVMKSWVREAHYRVVACSSFLAARRFLTRRVPGAVITDIRLGPFNGLQLIYLAKDTRPAVVVAVLADEEDSLLRNEASRAGAEFLVKPVTKEELLGQISAIRSEATGQTRAPK
jgi:DNA-binding response OmpR family regulator